MDDLLEGNPQSGVQRGDQSREVGRSRAIHDGVRVQVVVHADDHRPPGELVPGMSLATFAALLALAALAARFFLVVGSLAGQGPERVADVVAEGEGEPAYE